MKRNGKCVGKKSFAYYNQAEKEVMKNHLWWNFKKNKIVALGIYECPTCLYFHTTSKYDNRTQKQRWRCLQNTLKCTFPRTSTLLAQRYKDMENKTT